MRRDWGRAGKDYGRSYLNASVTVKTAVPFFSVSFSRLSPSPLPLLRSSFGFFARLFRTPSRLSRKGLLAAFIINL